MEKNLIKSTQRKKEPYKMPNSNTFKATKPPKRSKCLTWLKQQHHQKDQCSTSRWHNHHTKKLPKRSIQAKMSPMVFIATKNRSTNNNT